MSPRVAIGSDHAGYDLKSHLIGLLRARGQTAFDQYQAVPGQPLLTDLFVPESSTL